MGRAATSSTNERTAGAVYLFPFNYILCSKKPGRGCPERNIENASVPVFTQLRMATCSKDPDFFEVDNEIRGFSFFFTFRRYIFLFVKGSHLGQPMWRSPQ